MRCAIWIVSLGISCGVLPACAQSKGKESGCAGTACAKQPETPSAEGKGTNESSSTPASREAYKERLRQLSCSEGQTSDCKPKDGASSPAESGTRATDGAQSGVKPEPAGKESRPTEVQSQGQTPAQPVSLKPGDANGAQEAKPPASQSAAPSAPSAVPSDGCADAYCRSLNKTANGATPKPVPADTGRTLTTERNFVKNVVFDQFHIWESPFKLRDSDATWAVPFGILTGSLVATDRDVSRQLAKPSRFDTSKKISDYGLYSFIAGGAGFYGLGLMTHDDHTRETGLLAGEAVINATLVAEALKYAFGRERPLEGDGFGHIGRGGSSFPSGHSIDSWAAATVFAHEYPNPFMQVAAYGLASAVSVSRITAGQHFPSDVLVGSTFGYLIGRKIYSDHHNPELSGSQYGTFVREGHHDAEHSGSAYVPLESWVYPVIDRLAALGYVHSNFDSERPFTRLECARLAAEADENVIASDEASADVRSMVSSLQQEFAPETEVWAGNSENRSAVLESVYTRATEISGPVLRDGYHFGQTLYNDYGRPYGQGFNNVTGFSARATSGPLVLYFRGEYQHAPGNPDYTAAQKAIISAADEPLFDAANAGAPVRDNQFSAANGFAVLDAYIGVNFEGNQLTLGQQSLWWGPGAGGPFLLSNNADPLRMLRLNRVSPIQLPGPFKFFGPMRFDAFLGQIAGPYFIFHNNGTTSGFDGPNLKTGPFLQGQRFTFKPTENLEFGLTHTSTFGGDGFPLTTKSFIDATFSTGNTVSGLGNKPGDRRSGFDIYYRLPKLRDSMALYVEEFSEDEIFPLFLPRRSAMHPGIYLPKLPKLPRMDLRVEGIYTDIPSFGAREAPGFFYFNGTWRSGFTQNGNLMGSWIGRDGRGVFATSTLWLSPRNTIQLAYREAVADKQFLSGGRYQDESVRANFSLKRNLDISAMLQYENWRFPVLADGLQTNVSSSIQLTYRPEHHFWMRGENK